MKKTILTILLSTISIFIVSQDFHWAKQGIGEGGNGLGVACDDFGNNVFALQIRDEITWEGVTYTSYNPDTNYVWHSDDLLIIMIDSLGNTNWTYQIGSGSYFDYYGDEINDIVFDRNGEVIVCGDFCANEIFYKGVLTDTVDYTGFIMKLDNQGNLKWINFTNTVPQKITTDLNNDIYFAGKFRTYGIYMQDTLFGADQGTCQDMCVYKLDSNGNLIWNNHAGTPPGLYSHNNNVEALDIGINSQNEVFVAGQFSLYAEPNMFITFGNDTLFYSRRFWNEGFLASLNNQGEYTTVEGGLRSINNIEIDVNDNIILAGTFFDSLVNSYIQIINDFGRYAYLMKLNSNMELDWYKEFTSRVSSAIDIASDNEGIIYYSGTFSEYINVYDTILTTSENSNYIMKIEPDGNYEWINTMPGGVRYADDNIALNPVGDIAYTGHLYNAEVFGNYVLDPYTNNTTHFFVSLFAPNGTSHPNELLENGIIVNDLYIYPNPTEDLVNIGLNGNFELQLFNNRGQMILKKNFSSKEKQQLNLKGLPAGSYTIIVNSGADIFRTTLILTEK